MKDETEYAELLGRVHEVRAVVESGAAAMPTRPACFTAFFLTPRTVEFYSGGHENYANDRWLYVRRAAGDEWERLRLQA